MFPICSRVFFNSLAIAVCPCVAICAELDTPSCSALVTLSSRCETLCPIVAICPELCAWAIAIVCTSRRSSFICPSSSAFFFCSWDVCSTSQSTSPATKITAPMSTGVILSPIHLRETVFLLYSHWRAKTKGPRLREALSSISLLIRLTIRPARRFLLPIHFHRKLELPRIIRRRRLPRVRPKHIDCGDIEPVWNIEDVGDQIKTEALLKVDALGHAHVAEGHPRRQPRIAPQIPVQGK